MKIKRIKVLLIVGIIIMGVMHYKTTYAFDYRTVTVNSNNINVGF